ncbi:efflux RND transporter periplasmic adaptor subunit [Flammeovirga aprica]|uniref:Efflux RND transporter periplasmic adaptor subunit n=1 Tax=Flammeovirga aprica JL-4 TaxID=694437 RepID=A0A7X9P1Z5_9BACT|nr:efflux RND transporter periplasmic adaptor subunit [Flammeovirga aprica]NME68076.1 efflux RND transporter periplasmic adaptor subunit [Flammeovirga aprica JL-4]
MKKNLTISISLLFLFSLLFSCSEEEQQKKEVIRPVKVITTTTADYLSNKTFSATTKETKESSLSFRVGGPLIRLNAEEGQDIKKGNLIAEIDPRDFKINVQAKKARFIQAKAEKTRYEGLLAKGSIPQNEYDQKLAAYLIAKSEYEDAENALKDTKLYAPFNAIVSKKLVENYQEVAAKQPIASLLDFSAIEVKFTIPESFIRYFDYVTSFKVKLNAYPDVVFDATLKEVGARSEGATGFPVFLYLTTTKDMIKNTPVGSGMACQVTVEMDQRNTSRGDVILLPIYSVLQKGADKSPSVMVFDPAKKVVNKREVRLGQLVDKDKIQILGGLKSGELVVEYGANLLQDGQKARVLDFNPTASK